jgi:hypothetical protein
MWLNQDILQWLLPRIVKTAMISIICFIIIGDALGIVCLFSNPTLPKTLFGLFLFCPATFVFLVTLLSSVWGGFLYITDNGDGRKYQRGLRMLTNGMIASFFSGTFILLTDVIFLKVPFGIHLLFSYSFLLLGLFSLRLYNTTGLAIPEEDKKTRFITLLENILPIEFHEEWLGDLQEQHHQSIKEGKPPWKVGFITLLTGLGLIRSYLWLESDKLVSRWMTRAKKVFLG